MANAPACPEEGSAAKAPIGSDIDYGNYYAQSFERHVAWVQNMYSSLGRHGAEDVVSEAFELLYPSRASIRHPDGAFKVRMIGLAKDKIAKRQKSLNDTSVVGHALSLTSDDDSPATICASQECAELFSDEAVARLVPSERKLYDLYVQGNTLASIATLTGQDYEQVKDEFKSVFVNLFDAMAKIVTLDTVSLARESAALKSPQGAEKAMSRLPRYLSNIVRLSLVDKLPALQIAIRLKMASAEEVSRHLDRALSALERMYRAKMPDALIAALEYKTYRNG